MKRGITVACVAALIISGSTPIAAQERPVCVIDTAAHIDTVTLYLALGPVDTTASRRGWYQSLILAVADSFKTPNPLGLPNWPGTVDPNRMGNSTDVVSSFGLAGFLSFRLDRNGKLKGNPKATAGTRSLNSALVDAVKGAAIKPLPVLDPKEMPPDGEVRLRVREVLYQPPSDGIAIVRVQFPALRIDTSPRMLRMADMTFPAGGVLTGTEGFATYQFVIDETGRVIGRTLRLVDADFIEYADVARDGLERSMFHPARVGNCPVQSLITYRIDFRLRH